MSSKQQHGRNPYLDARREWDERYGSLTSSIKFWRLAALLAAAAACITGVGLMSVAGKSHIQPYVVEVDHLGNAVAVGKAQTSAALSQQVIKHEVARWLYDTRSVVTDVPAEKRLINEAYAMSAPTVANQLNSYYQSAGHSPFARLQKGSVTVSITDMLKQSKHAYRVQWTEKRLGKAGEIKQVQHWEAIIGYRVTPPASVSAAQKNPLGVYISSYSWSQTL